MKNCIYIYIYYLYDKFDRKYQITVNCCPSGKRNWVPDPSRRRGLEWRHPSSDPERAVHPEYVLPHQELGTCGAVRGQSPGQEQVRLERVVRYFRLHDKRCRWVVPLINFKYVPKVQSCVVPCRGTSHPVGLFMCFFFKPFI